MAHSQQVGSARRSTRQHVTTVTNQRIVEFQHQVDQYAGHFEHALPRHVSLDRFKRVLVTAASTNPDLLYADRRTLMLAAIRCASDGLMPDGRQAALVVYNTEIKRRDPETGIDHKFRIDAVQYMIMVSGIRERMRNTGEVASADAHVVHRNDKFHYSLGDNPYIEHEPPPLSEDRGDIIGAYAIIKLKNGEVLRDVMRKSEIEQTRSVSRAKDGPMWSKFYGEAARKTVLRRCSKAAPQAADLDRLIGGDDEPGGEPAALAELSELPAPEPQRAPDDRKAIEHDAPAYEVVDLDGQVFDYHEAKTAAEALRRVYAAAEQRGAAFLDGAIETNSELQIQLERHGEKFEMPQTEPTKPRTEAKADSGSGVAEKTEEPHSASPPADAAPPFPGDQPSRSDNLQIPIPNGKGREVFRSWVFGLFLPKVRQMTSSSDLALLLGDNERHLEDVKRQLGEMDRHELDQAITARWAEIEDIERQPA